MKPPEALVKELFKPSVKNDFNSICLEIFRFQAVHCEVYRTYIYNLGITPDSVTQIHEIPFLPIEFFKTHQVVSGKRGIQKIFESSGTTSDKVSRHHVADLEIYRSSFLNAFNFFYGDPGEWCILGLLPSYLERENSSLVFMIDELIKKSGHPLSGFHLYDTGNLIKKIHMLTETGQKIWLIGVTYALLDLAEQFKFPFTNTVLLETGGMKGNRPEMVREEVHKILCESFSLRKIHSEYGMTELLSQAYSTGNGVFSPPPWMRVLIRDINDPFSLLENNLTGGINIIDFANIYSCSFIATRDLGKSDDGNTFEILGRFDNSDIRGCNLLVG